jgi:hypothetical protein
MKNFNFCHDYYKLEKEAFTAIRGKSAAKQYEVGQVVDIMRSNYVPSNGTGVKLYSAEIMAIQVRKLVDIPFGVMLADGEYKGLKIYNKMDFLGLMNSFRKWKKIKLKSLNDEVAVFYLWRCENG